MYVKILMRGADISGYSLVTKFVESSYVNGNCYTMHIRCLKFRMELSACRNKRLVLSSKLLVVPLFENRKNFVTSC